MNKTIKVKEIDHYEDITIPGQKPIYKVVDVVMNACDKCGKPYSGKLPTCIGCGYVLCYLCNRNEDLECIQLWVGTQEEYGDNYHIKGSDDFDTESFYICKTCKETPPNEIKFILKQKIVDKLEDEIKKVTQEMIIDVRKRKYHMCMGHDCFWKLYQENQTFANMTRWLKHRSYVKNENQCLR